MASELQNRNQVIDLDRLISGLSEPRRGGQMCRKSFYVYEKVVNARAIVEANAVNALDAIAPVTLSLAHGMLPYTSRTSCNPGITASTSEEWCPTPMFSPDLDITQGRKQFPDVTVRFLQSVPVAICKYTLFHRTADTAGVQKAMHVRSNTQP